ncbi:H/ACA ribonucleoprotein complex subunit 3 [Nematocida ausubeli]|nr:H/ACA ribonucleoprotein complex subunit 3 [Nematocida ausubeli]
MAYIGYKLEDTKKVYKLYDQNIKSDILPGHPARFSPDDKFSQERIQLKLDHKLLPL